MKLEFMTTKKGFVKCKTHSNFVEFINLLKDGSALPEGDLKNDKAMKATEIYRTIHTCSTCVHYINDDCYFSKKEIKKIGRKVGLTLYRCKFCGGYIDSVYYVLYKKYSKNELDLTIPFQCCQCYKSLSNNDFSEQLKEYLIWFAGTLIFSAILITVLYFLTYPFNFVTLLLIITLPSVFLIGTAYSLFKFIKLKISLKKSEFLKHLRKKSQI